MVSSGFSLLGFAGFPFSGERMGGNLRGIFRGEGFSVSWQIFLLGVAHLTGDVWFSSGL